MTVRTRLKALAATGVLATAAVAAPTSATAMEPEVSEYSAEGLQAHAIFSTLPEGATARRGVFYTDTSVYTADQVITFDGFPNPQRDLVVRTSIYTVNAKGKRVVLSESNGFGGGDDMTLTWSRKLNSVKLSTPVNMMTCDPITTDCTFADAQLQVTWRGKGRRTHVDTQRSFEAGGEVTVSGERGVRRAARASGSFGKVDLGVTKDASLFNGTQWSRTTCYTEECVQGP